MAIKLKKFSTEKKYLIKYSDMATYLNRRKTIKANSPKEAEEKFKEWIHYDEWRKEYPGNYYEDPVEVK